MPFEPDLSKLTNPWLFGAAVLTFAASFLHVLIMIGGANWYRFFGAGEQMALMAERGQWYPVAITSVITVVLFLWGLYALAGSGIVKSLPLLKPVLLFVTVVFLLRGCALLPYFRFDPSLSANFWIWSSAISLLVGIVYLVGLYQLFGGKGAGS